METNYFDDEFHGGDTARAKGEEVVMSDRETEKAFGQPEGGFTSGGEESDESTSALWENDPDGKAWMNDWNGREETHAMFRQSYE